MAFGLGKPSPGQKHGYYASSASLGKAFSSKMKLCRALIDFIIRVKYFSECCVYLQEYFAIFILGVKRVQAGGSTKIFEVKLLRTWVEDTESRIKAKLCRLRPTFFCLLLEGNSVVCVMHG